MNLPIKEALLSSKARKSHTLRREAVILVLIFPQRNGHLAKHNQVTNFSSYSTRDPIAQA